MSVYPEYRYVDCWARVNGRQTQWTRWSLDASSIVDWSRSMIHAELFKTEQRFDSPSVDPEGAYIMPLVMDFDGRTGTAKEKTASALEDVRKLYSWFEEALGIEGYVKVYFSGGKGFHVTVDPSALGMKPSNHLVQSVEMAARYLCNLLSLKTMDFKVYQRRHVWRIVGSKHEKTGLRKCLLDPSDLMLSVDEIMGIANQEHPVILDDWGDIEKTTDWFDQFEEEASSRKTHIRTQPKENVLKHEIPGMAECMGDLMSDYHKRAGDRHRANFFMALYFRDSGVKEKDTAAYMNAWAAGIPANLTNATASENEASAHNTVKSVYDKSQQHYRFDCRAIRSLGIPGDPIACVGEALCPHVNEDKALRERPVALSLEEALLPEYHGDKDIRVELACYLAAREDEPTSIPVHCSVTCKKTEKGYCESCPSNGESVEVLIEDTSRDILGLLGLSTKATHSYIKKMAGVKTVGRGTCPNAMLKELKNKNVSKCVIQPHVEFSDPSSDVAYRRNTTYVIAGKVRANNRYTLSGKTYPMPKDRKVVHIIDKVTPLKTASNTFKFSEENHKSMLKFQGDPEEMFDDIHNVLEQHCHGIFGRRMYSIIVDVVIHSILHLHWDGKVINRGWLEAAIIGDTDQGKTTLVRRLLEYYGVGQIVTMEGATEAGLTGAAMKYGDTWMVEFGALCRNDGGIVVLDECQNAPEGLIPRLNSVREDGKAVVEKAGKGEAGARCRKLFIANPPFGRGLSEFSYGVEAVKGIFKQEGAVRRLDIAVGLMRSRELTKEIYKQHLITIENKYPQQDSRMLIQWAWTRGASNLRWANGCENVINKHALAMIDRYYDGGMPLVSTGSQSIKIARMAAAVAARLYSTSNGRTLEVLPIHADYAVKLMDMAFTDDAMAYGAWSARMIDLNKVTDGEIEKFKLALIDELGINTRAFIQYVCDTDYFQKQQLVDEWQAPGLLDELKRVKVVNLLSYMTSNNIVSRGHKGSGYRKTSKGIVMIRELKNANLSSITVTAEVEDILEKATELTTREQAQLDKLGW